MGVAGLGMVTGLRERGQEEFTGGKQGRRTGGFTEGENGKKGTGGLWEMG